MGFFSFGRKRSRSDALTALHICQDGVAIAATRKKGTQRLLTYAKYCEVSNPLSNSVSVAKQIEEAGLSNSYCSLLLSANEYQLLLVDAPEVPDDELKEALLWRIKDLIQFSTDDAILDYFELPEDAFRGRGKMIYVVVAEKSLIEKRVAWLESLSLQPIAIDIPELALLNVTDGVSEAEAGTAVLFLQNNQSFLSMLSGGDLYMSRGLSYDPDISIDNTVLDLQRSMDYFESQIGKPPCVRILVMPLQVGETPLMMSLRENLAADVQSLDLGEMTESEEPLNIDVQQRCSLAISAAFRASRRL